MRVLFSTWPAPGHVLLLLPLVDAARRAGHDVILASGAEGVATAAAHGVATWEVGPSRAESDAVLRATLDVGALPPHERIPAVVAGMFGRAAFDRAERLVPLATAWRPDLVVHPISELAGAVAAAHGGAVGVVHGLGPLPAEAWDWFGSRFDELCRRWHVPALADEVLGHPYLDTCPPSLQTDAVAAFGDRRPVRPTAIGRAGDTPLPWDEETWSRLPHPRTVHLTMGTLFHGVTGVFETVLDGLRRLPVNVVVALGPGADLGRLGPQPRSVLVTDFVPHAALLPRCHALITQGGAGTILAALEHGLPHLILPQGADQFANAETAVAAGLARRLLPDELDATRITAEVAGMLDDQALAANVARAQAEVRAMPSADEVIDELAADLAARVS